MGGGTEGSSPLKHDWHGNDFVLRNHLSTSAVVREVVGDVNRWARQWRQYINNIDQHFSDVGLL